MYDLDNLVAAAREFRTYAIKLEVSDAGANVSLHGFATTRDNVTPCWSSRGSGPTPSAAFNYALEEARVRRDTTDELSLRRGKSGDLDLYDGSAKQPSAKRSRGPVLKIDNADTLLNLLGL